MSVMPRARMAHPPGPSYAAYTPNGVKLISIGQSPTIRVFKTGSVNEPFNIDDCSDPNLAVATGNDFFLAGAEDGTVAKYSLVSNTMVAYIARSTLPIRDIAITPDGEWAAIASDELVVKLVNIEDPKRVHLLREQTKGVKHVTIDPKGKYLTASCADGVIYIYSLEEDEPEFVTQLDGIIKVLETDADSSSRAVWHPDGRAFGVQNRNGDIQVISAVDWATQRSFQAPSEGSNITAAAWSPNGAILATTGPDLKLHFWDARTRKTVRSIPVRTTILTVNWHPTDNLISFSDNDGDLHIWEGILPADVVPLLRLPPQPAPFLHDPLDERARNLPLHPRGRDRPRQGTPDSLNAILGPDIVGIDDDDDDGKIDIDIDGVGHGDGNGDGFIDDDDGAGYAEAALNAHGKRGNDHLAGGARDGPAGKRRATDVYAGAGAGGRATTSMAYLHPPFQPGSTPWRGNRRYLCINLIGVVWTIDHDDHNTITVEFYDQDEQRDFHFTDPFLYDKASLTRDGAVFACRPAARAADTANADTAAAAAAASSTVYYRPHQTWAGRADWRTRLPPGELVHSIALSDSFVVVVTSAGYVRLLTRFGQPVRMWRPKSGPVVSCAAWCDYVLTVANGAVGAADGAARLVYSIEDVRADRVCQAEDGVALTPASELRAVFFSDNGDPYIYDSTGVLLTLEHWREPGQARWAPMLDTRLLPRLAGGRRAERYWPIAVSRNRFFCFILKGQDPHPSFPRPLLTDFELRVPLSGPDDDDGAATAAANTAGDAAAEARQLRQLEENFVRDSVLRRQLNDRYASAAGKDRPTRQVLSLKADLAAVDVALDKVLLQLLAIECRQGEERGPKALELAGMLRDSDGSGKMVDAAAKIAARFGRESLRDKIIELAERRLASLTHRVNEPSANGHPGEVVFDEPDSDDPWE